MKYVQRLLWLGLIGSLGFSCTRVVVVERQAPGRSSGNPHSGYKKGHPHGMPPGQAKKLGRH